MMYGVGVGMRLIRISVGVWGTPAFWNTIGWWHNEVHYTIPRIREEKRVAVELELAFGVGAVTSIPYGVTSFAINNTNPNITLGGGEFNVQRPASHHRPVQVVYRGVAVGVCGVSNREGSYPPEAFTDPGAGGSGMGR